LIELFDTMLFSRRFPRRFSRGGRTARLRLRPRAPAAVGRAIVDRLALQRVLQCILADFGVVDAPAEGCVPRTGNLERDKVLQVTEAVMAKLRQRGG
jgi:hypothetical protein